MLRRTSIIAALTLAAGCSISPAAQANESICKDFYKSFSESVRASSPLRWLELGLTSDQKKLIFEKQIFLTKNVYSALGIDGYKGRIGAHQIEGYEPSYFVDGSLNDPRLKEELKRICSPYLEPSNIEYLDIFVK